MSILGHIFQTSICCECTANVVYYIKHTRHGAFYKEFKMYSIGLITTERSLRHIMKIDLQLREQCNITYLPYSSPEHLKFLYEQNADRFDAFLFSGSYPYNVLKRQFGTINKPHAHFDISDRDYYRLIAELAVQEPTLDFTRVYFDRPEITVDFYSIFHRTDAPLLGSAGIDWQTEDASDWYLPLQQYYLSVWESGKADLLVTRFGSMSDYFAQHQIRHRYLSPSSESMLQTFRGLMMQLSAGHRHDAAASIGIVCSQHKLTEEQWKLLGTRLQSCNRQLGMPFLIYEHGDHYEITTNSSVLQDLSQEYTACPITTFLDGGTDFPVCVGWGCAGTVIDAHRNAQRAARQALLCKSSASFIVMDDNVIIGPLSNVRRIAYSEIPSVELAKLSRSISLSPIHLSKIASILTQKGNDTISAEELAFYLDLTTRSASRILSRLESGGLATVQYNRQLNMRGRPAKIYKINLQNIPTP